MYLEDFPLNGFLFCYGPLALMIIGFIIFAALTDVNARRSYLRRGIRPNPSDRTIVAQTPAGAEVMIGPKDQINVARTIAAPPRAAPIAPPTEPPVAEAVEPEADDDDPDIGGGTMVEEDNLQRIEGIGPKSEAALKAIGITTFAQIAAMDSDELTRLVKEEQKLRIVGDAATWIKQAQFLVDGDEDGLQAYQNRLVGGREPDDEASE